MAEHTFSEKTAIRMSDSTAGLSLVYHTKQPHTQVQVTQLTWSWTCCWRGSGRFRIPSPPSFL